MKRILLFLLFVFLAGTAVGGYYAYGIFLKPNVKAPDDGDYIYIKTGSSFYELQTDLTKRGIIEDVRGFRIAARVMEFDRKIIPGRYKIEDRMNNTELIKLL